MPLELRNDRAGRIRPYWYGRFEENGKRHCVNLQVKVAGNPPSSLRDLGDSAFERSRGEAQAKLKALQEDLRSRSSSARMIEKLHEIKTGEKLQSIPLADLTKEWKGIPRRKEPTDAYAKQCARSLDRFVAFVQRYDPGIREIGQVTRPVAQKYMTAEGNRGIAAKTWNDGLKLLRSTFGQLRHKAGLTDNPFKGIPTKEVEHVFREPFSVEDLTLILEVAKRKEHEFIRPIIITAACTAMRRGDCASLRWSGVDLDEGFITVKTSKTGQTVDIPIFPMLEGEIRSRSRDRNVNEFVFPEQAEMYQSNPDGLTYRLRKVLADAGFRDQSDETRERRTDDSVSDQDKRQVGHRMIDKITNPAKRDRMRRAFDLYMQGKPLFNVAEELGIGKCTVSAYLNDVESQTGVEFIRGKLRKRKERAPFRGNIHVARETGQRSASVRDFHSFRTTWITLALTSEIPLDIVKKITGHKTVEVVMKHYFRPNRDQLRTTLQKKMPGLLTAGQRKTTDEAIQEILLKSNADTAWQDLQSIRDLLQESASL